VRKTTGLKGGEKEGRKSQRKPPCRTESVKKDQQKPEREGRRDNKVHEKHDNTSAAAYLKRVLVEGEERLSIRATKNVCPDLGVGKKERRRKKEGKAFGMSSKK